MTQLNPYAAPQVANPFAPVAPSANKFPGLWRSGHLLVWHKAAPLPDICLKSNEPATRRLKRNLQWHSPLVFLALLVNIIVYIVIAMIMRKTATLFMPLTEEWFARRRKRMLIAWGIVGLAVLMFAGGCVVANDNFTPVLIIGSILTLIGAIIYGLVACRLVTPTRITDEYVWLKGVSPAYLDRLEPWPYNI